MRVNGWVYRADLQQTGYRLLTSAVVHQIPLSPLVQKGTFTTGNQAVGAIPIGIGADTKNA